MDIPLVTQPAEVFTKIGERKSSRVFTRFPVIIVMHDGDDGGG
jgi:hypothetical protein